LEAASLIEDYLAEEGRHRYIITDDESWQYRKLLSFFWKLFSSQSGITVRLGRALDVFGNFVDDEGRSIGPNGTTIDPAKWLTTMGELRGEPQRDYQYTRELGEKIVERFHCENIALSSHLVAFTLFEALRKCHSELDLYHFLRLAPAQRTIPLGDFFVHAESCHRKLLEAADRGLLFLSDELRSSDTRAWVADGVRNLGLLHDAAVVTVRDGAIWTEDMNLLYYYRNRLTGYGLNDGLAGQNDGKGFLE
jgi:glycerol-3-phosphate O-acyltransferase